MVCLNLRTFKNEYLVAAKGVVEFAEVSLVAVGHVITPAEEHQGTGVFRQGAPVHFNAGFLLRETQEKM